MKIAVVGCAHGELQDIYDTIQLLEEREKFKVDLLICCGDFQATRNNEDLACMAVPPKYAKICTFYKYYSGESTAPVLTIFIGGNHEASNYLQELPYGGWVAPNILYMGYAGVINIAGIRIAGLSGIYKSRDYMKGHYEKLPYDENSKRSVYHIRNLDVFRLKQLSGKVDIFLSHDWPSDVTKYGNLKQLLRKKPFFKEDIECNKLGSAPCEELLHHIKPSYWFSAHLHCKFAALIKHDDDSTTKFLALDKCLPKRRFLQVLDVPHDGDSTFDVNYDLEWLSILYLTDHLLSVRNVNNYMPGPGCTERYNFVPSEDEKKQILSRFINDLKVPKNFAKTAPPFDESAQKSKTQPTTKLNPQTANFCEKLAIHDPIVVISESDGSNLTLSVSMDDYSNNTTFVDDTVIEDRSTTSESSPLKKMGSLSLPEPKLSQSDDDDSKSEGEEEVGSADSPEGGAKEVVEMKELEEATCDSPAPTPKKLKRRNENLYKVEDT